MADTLKTLKVIIEGDTGKYKKTLDEVRNQTKKAMDDIRKETGNVQAPELQGAESTMQKLRALKNQIKSTMNEFRNKAGLNSEGLFAASDQFKSLGRGALRRAGVTEDTDEYKQVNADIERAEKSLDRLNAKSRDMNAAGISKQDKAWQKLQAQIRRTERQLDTYKGKANSMEYTGASSQFKGIKNMASGALQKGMGGLQAAFKKIGPSIKSAGGTFGSLIQKFKSGIPLLGKLGKSMNSTGQSGRRMGGIFSTIGMTARFMFASMLLMGALNGAKEGMNNLAQYSDRTNQSLSMLMSALTQLKNSLATAFAPILNFIAPALTSLINLASKAATAVGALMSALTGQGFVKAKAVNQDYAASLGSNAAGATKANKANKDLQKTLLGFDQINKMNDDSSDSGAGDAGGGVAGGGLSPGDMFETAEIPDSIKNFANKIKEAWKNADFTEIGGIVGEKLNSALESINWDKIKNTTAKIAKSTATFLNGFIDKTDWKLVGSTIAEGFNTAINTAYVFVTTFDWKKFGTAISESVNGFFETIDWKKVGSTISESIKGILDTLISAIQGIDWKMVGESVKTALVNIDWSGIVNRVFELIGSALGGLAAFLGGLLGDAVVSAQSFFSDKIEECGGNVVLGILKGIGEALLGIGQWIVDNIFSPIVDGFKSAFGIHSPSTVMAEQGGYIIDGLLNGLMSGIGAVITWMIELPGKIIGALGNAKDWLVEKGKDAIEGLKDGWEAIKESSLGKTVSGIGSFIKEKAGNAKSWLSEKGKSAIEGIRSGWESVRESNLGKTVSKIGEQVKEKAGNAKEWISQKGKDAISGVSSGWETVKDSTFLSKVRKIGNETFTAIGNISSKVKSKGSDIINGLRSGFDSNIGSLLSQVSSLPSKISNGIGDLWNIGRNAISSFARGFASINIKMPHLDVGWNKYSVGSLSFSVPKFNLSWYAKGGFPDMGEMFVAREAGPEMVGRMGKRNAVANNNQIVDGIKAGVSEAMMDVMMAFQGSSGEGEAPVIEFTLLVDSETFYRLTKRGEQKVNRRYEVVEQIT